MIDKNKISLISQTYPEKIKVKYLLTAKLPKEIEKEILDELKNLISPTSKVNMKINIEIIDYG